MALLIDGYNLLHVTDIFAGQGAGTELHRSRLALLNFLGASLSKRDRAQTTIVFDAAGAPPGLPSQSMHEGMQVYFARRHADADEMIENLLDGWQAPKSLTVVSSDHRIQRAARRSGAGYIDSDRWFADLQVAQRVRKAEQAIGEAKPDSATSPEDTAYWLDEFTKRPEKEKGGG
jgi:predicted RNA-binding protein with PIN domain